MTGTALFTTTTDMRGMKRSAISASLLTVTNYRSYKKMLKLKTFILTVLENKGWSTEELDHRLKRAEGFTSDFISDSKMTKLPSSVLTALSTVLDISYDELLKMNQNVEEDTSFLYTRIEKLRDMTEYGNIRWDRVDGKIAFVSSDENEDIRRAFTRRDKEGSHFPPYYPEKETYEAGPTYHYRTRTSVDVFISKTVAENCGHTGYNYRNVIYLTDKRGYLLGYTELSDKPNLSEKNILKDFAALDLNALYDDLLFVNKDSLYEMP